MTTMNVEKTETGDTVYTYKGRNMYEGLSPTEEAFVRVIEKELGEIVACSVSCVLAKETQQLVCVTDLQLSLIRDYARMHEFALPPSLEK
jgi:hypothetical protein